MRSSDAKFLLAAVVLAGAAWSCDEEFSPGDASAGSGGKGASTSKASSSDASTGTAMQSASSGQGGHPQAVPCGDPPAASGVCDMTVCTSCSDDTCYILCDQQGDCQGTVQCPPGMRCQVTCSGIDSCRGQIQCADDQPCTITCSAEGACRQAEILCGERSDCNLVCNTDLLACDQAVVSCGDGACTAQCFGASFPMVQCESSCDCQPCL